MAACLSKHNRTIGEPAKRQKQAKFSKFETSKIIFEQIKSHTKVQATETLLFKSNQMNKILFKCQVRKPQSEQLGDRNSLQLERVSDEMAFKRPRNAVCGLHHSPEIDREVRRALVRI